VMRGLMLFLIVVGVGWVLHGVYRRMTSEGGWAVRRLDD